MLDLIIGTTWSYCRGGATVDSVVVSATAKPDTTPAGNWTKGPTIQEAVIEPVAGTRIVRRGPVNGGRYGNRKAYTLGRSLRIRLSLQQWTPLTFEQLFQAPAAVVKDTAFIPGVRQAADVEIWAKLQMYHADDTEVFPTDVYAAISMGAYTFGEKLDPYALTLDVLSSDLNTGIMRQLVEVAMT